MKNAVYWNIKTHFIPHRRHLTSPLLSPAVSCYVRFVDYTAVTLKVTHFWKVKRCVSCNNRRFGRMCHLYLKGEKIRELAITLAVTTNER
jgi:hypothetical protein